MRDFLVGRFIREPGCCGAAEASLDGLRMLMTWM